MMVCGVLGPQATPTAPTSSCTYYAKRLTIRWRM